MLQIHPHHVQFLCWLFMNFITLVHKINHARKKISLTTRFMCSKILGQRSFFSMGEDYLFSQMKCMVCLIAECKENLLSPKLDILHKHVGWKKTIATSLYVVIEDYYFNKDSSHSKNKGLMLASALIWFWIWCSTKKN